MKTSSKMCQKKKFSKKKEKIKPKIKSYFCMFKKILVWVVLVLLCFYIFSTFSVFIFPSDDCVFTFSLKIFAKGWKKFCMQNVNSLNYLIKFSEKQKFLVRKHKMYRYIMKRLTIESNQNRGRISQLNYNIGNYWRVVLR